MVEITSTGPADTLAVGRRLAALLRPGDVIALCGPLGAGKTLLAGGIAEGLGVAEPVVSPSFVLVRSYQGFLRMVHADAYRLDVTAELEDLALDEEGTDAVIVVEWGNAVAGALPDDHLSVTLEVVSEDVRTIRLVPRGSWDDRPLHEVGP